MIFIAARLLVVFEKYFEWALPHDTNLFLLSFQAPVGDGLLQVSMDAPFVFDTCDELEKFKHAIVCREALLLRIICDVLTELPDDTGGGVARFRTDRKMVVTAYVDKSRLDVSLSSVSMLEA